MFESTYEDYIDNLVVHMKSILKSLTTVFSSLHLYLAKFRVDYLTCLTRVYSALIWSYYLSNLTGGLTWRPLLVW